VSGSLLLPKLHFVEAFLTSRGWTLAVEGERFRAYEAPEALRLGEGVRLTLPREADSSDIGLTLLRIRDVLVELYQLPPERLTPVLSAGGVVTSIQMESADYESGTLPFERFEGMVEKLKKTLLDAATFVVTDEPISNKVSPEAKQYLRACRFLQSEVGSYVANVQLPSKQHLVEASLLRDQPILSDDVNAKLPEIVEFVVGPIFNGNSDTFSESGVDDAMDVLNLNVLKDVGMLLANTGAREVKFSFMDIGGERVVRSGELSASKFTQLKRYLELAKHRLKTESEIEVVGRITLLRSTNPDRGPHWVGVHGLLDGKPVLATFTMNKRDHSEAVMAYRRGKTVRVRGLARRMRTQVRISRVESFEELGS
jgi:hypothetical protein